MSLAQIQWRLDVISHGDRLTDAVSDEIGDMNETKFLVHGVMARALNNMTGPVSRRELDTDMGRALRRRASALRDFIGR